MDTCVAARQETRLAAPLATSLVAASDVGMVPNSSPGTPPSLGRPKSATQVLRHASLRSIYGARCSITLLGEQEYLKFKNRPHSSVGSKR